VISRLGTSRRRLDTKSSPTRVRCPIRLVAVGRRSVAQDIGRLGHGSFGLARLWKRVSDLVSRRRRRRRSREEERQPVPARDLATVAPSEGRPHLTPPDGSRHDRHLRPAVDLGAHHPGRDAAEGGPAKRGQTPACVSGVHDGSASRVAAEGVDVRRCVGVCSIHDAQRRRPRGSRGVGQCEGKRNHGNDPHLTQDTPPVPRSAHRLPRLREPPRSRAPPPNCERRPWTSI
jgi:hypothetical protein